MYGVMNRGADGNINLQATLSASSAIAPTQAISPHHPITCSGQLRYEEDDSFSCEHATVPADDERTRYCIDHSIALLMIELARAL